MVIIHDLARVLIGNKRVIEFDYEILQHETIMINFNKMYRNILHNDPESWTATSFLKGVKEKLHNFEYTIHHGTGGKPDAIFYMTS